jgi:GNAT superfamily N-acetyltransferase
MACAGCFAVKVIDAIVAAHTARWRALDPLLPAANPLPQPTPGQTPMTVDDGVAVARHTRLDADAPAAAWSALDQHRLFACVGGPDPVAAMDGLLAQWADGVVAAAEPDDPDSSACVNWPSRDTAMTRLFLDRGMVPHRVMAARPAGRPGPPVTTSAAIRPLTGADLDHVVRLHVEQIRWGEQFGGGAVRPAAAELARQEYTGMLAHDDPWTWVAELDGRVVGMVTVTPPERAGWLAPLSAARTPAYVGTTLVLAPQRAGGIGAALVARAHAALDGAGVDVVLLHYAPLNPLSAPFWHRAGYRPLWTWWAVGPASRLRPGRSVDR